MEESLSIGIWELVFHAIGAATFIETFLYWGILNLGDSLLQIINLIFFSFYSGVVNTLVNIFVPMCDYTCRLIPKYGI